VPYYEFYCAETHTVYTFFARSLQWANRVPRCPDPAHAEAVLVKQVSRFAVTGKAKEDLGSDPTGLDDPRMERAMAEMEREFSGLSEENPDPRQLGRLMRRMGDLMGSAWTPEIEEMARRLEAGEDPDRIEEKFGDALDESMAASAGEPGVPGGALGRISRTLRRELRRDPRVYEMREYLDPS
jgi:hypothetical protein